MNRLNVETRARIIGCLVEGMSMRATTRLVGCSINTITKLLVDLGTACALFQNEHLHDLPCKRVQVDEIWAFTVASKRTRLLKSAQMLRPRRRYLDVDCHRCRYQTRA